MSARRVLTVLVVAVLALGAGACGGSSGKRHDGPTTTAKRGGHLTVLAADDVDFVDPAQTYYAFGYTVHYAVNRPLYSYGPGDAGQPRPDVADGAPRVSADGRTVTVRIKPGIRYAPPVDREVSSKDVKYAFERAFSAHVASPCTRTASDAALGTKFCGLPAAKVAICPNFSFTRDYNDPQGLLDPVFNGRNIVPANNANWSQLDDPVLNRAMDAAARLPAGATRNRAWGAVDRMATEQAPGIPFLWDTVPTVEAADVRGVVNGYSTSWDLSFTSLK